MKCRSGSSELWTLDYSQGTGKWYELQDLQVTDILPQMITLSEAYIQVSVTVFSKKQSDNGESEPHRKCCVSDLEETWSGRRWKQPHRSVTRPWKTYQPSSACFTGRSHQYQSLLQMIRFCLRVLCRFVSICSLKILIIHVKCIAIFPSQLLHKERTA